MYYFVLLHCITILSTQDFWWTVTSNIMQCNTTIAASEMSTQLIWHLSTKLELYKLHRGRIYCRTAALADITFYKCPCLCARHSVYSYMQISMHERTYVHSLPWLQLLLLICHPFSIPPAQTNSTWTAPALANPALWHLHLECFWFIKSSQHCGKFTFTKSPLEWRLKRWSKAGKGETKSKLKGAHLSAWLLSWKPYCVKM